MKELLVHEKQSELNENRKIEKFENPEISKENNNLWSLENKEVDDINECQELSQEMYHQAIEHIYFSEGGYMPRDTLERIKKGPDVINITPYKEGSGTVGCFYFHNGYSTIEVSNISKDQMERTMQHEVNHFSSFNREVPFERSDREYVLKACGVRRTEVRLTEDGEIGGILEDKYRGMNEGITSMFTHRQLGEISPEKEIAARRENGYESATILCEGLRDAIGEDTIKEAYYGGDLEQLRNVIDINAGIDSFERLARDMDRVTYSSDYAIRIESMKEAQEILARVWEGVHNND